MAKFGKSEATGKKTAAQPVKETAAQPAKETAKASKPRGPRASTVAQWDALIVFLHAVIAVAGVPATADVVGSAPVGRWAAELRAKHRKKALPPAQVAACEAICGWWWEMGGDTCAGSGAAPEVWEGVHAILRHVYTTTGAPRLVDTFRGADVGRWAGAVRRRGRTGALPAAQRAAYDAIPGWQWEVRRGRAAGGSATPGKSAGRKPAGGKAAGPSVASPSAASGAGDSSSDGGGGSVGAPNPDYGRALAGALDGGAAAEDSSSGSDEYQPPPRAAAAVPRATAAPRAAAAPRATAPSGASASDASRDTSPLLAAAASPPKSGCC
jgi:hypothetical protein